MSVRSRLLSSCSLLLTLTGGNLFVCGNIMNSLRWLMRLAFLLVLAHESTECFLLFRGQGLTLFTLVAFVFILASFIVGLWPIMKQAAMERLLRQQVQVIPEATASRLLRRVIVVTVIFTIGWIIPLCMPDYTSTSASPIGVPQLIPLIRALGWDCVWMSCGAYYIFTSILFEYQKLVLEDIRHSLRKGNCCQASIRGSFCLMRDSTQTFDRLFAPIPFVWFCYQIVECPLLVQVIATMTQQQQAVRLISIAKEVLPPLAIVLLIANVQSRLAGVIDGIMDEIAGRTGDKKWSHGERLLMMQDLESMKRLRLTGACFFTLDRAFLTAYLGTLVTFSALISSLVKNNIDGW